MKQFLQVFLFLISIFFIISCTTSKGLIKEKDNISFVVKPLLQGEYNTALYKSKIDIGKKHFSGLFYFKAQKDSMSYRIVFLSEFGLNLLDLEYKNHEFIIKNCKEFLNRKIIINTLQKDLELLISKPLGENRHIYKDTNNKIAMVKWHKILKKYDYFYSSQKLYKIIAKQNFGYIEVKADNYKTEIPENIEIYNKRINLKIKLNLIRLN